EVVVSFVVKEKPSIAAIRYKGNNEIKDDKLTEKVTLEPHTILDVAEVKENVEKIRKAYVDKGFYLAEVDYEIKRPEKLANQVIVVYTIQEYHKVQVKKISLLGNEHISDDRLERIMKTREGSFMSIISKAGSFKKKTFEKDIQRLTAYYYDQGYVEVNVEAPTIRLSRDKKFLFITIRIQEGQQYDVGDIALKGDMLRKREVLREMIKFEGGQTFSYGQMRRDANKLKTLYQDEGYAFAQVKPLTRINREEQTVDLTFQLKKSGKVYFRRIEIVGNKRTRDKVIRRELEIKEGELYSKSAIKESKRDIKRLGYFKKVEITTQRADSNLIDATVRVEEKRTGNFQVGAGFSSTESFIFNLRFTEPWLFDTRWRASINAYNYSFVFQDFTRDSTGGELTFGYPISELLNLDLPGDLRAQAKYKLEDVQIESGGRTGTQLQRPGSFFEGGLTSSVTGELRYDSRNNRLFPSKGMLHTASVEYADDLTFSETQFLKYDWESRFYVPMFWEFVFRANAEIGYITGLSPNQPVPLFERYFVGGPKTVRGFDRYTLGPARQVARSGGDPASTLSEFNIGGNKQLLLTAEVEFPILKSAGLKGVVFADAGNAFDTGQPYTLALDVFTDPENNYSDALRTAIGAGIRWRSPLGPLRFEWGFPLQRLRGEDPMVFEFSIGNAF
ncbi:MAG: outer membrane protein assembly factor BamA, partial [Bradymonadaceae bacterium]